MSRRSCTLLFGAVALAISVGAQDKATLWTKITARARTITVIWDKKHPWDVMLASRPADLVAEYRSENRGIVSEVLSHAPAPGLTRTYRFTLPETTKSEPQGEVCLSVQPSGGRNLLPIRMPNSDKSDTARFRYDAWASLATRETTARITSLRLDAARRDLGIVQERIAAQEKAASERGWIADGKPGDQCEDLPTPANQPMVKPYDVVSPDDQDDTARRICVYRAWNGSNERTKDWALAVKLASVGREKDARGIFLESFRIAPLPEAADSLFQQRPAGANEQIAIRQDQAALFMKDWTRWSASAKDYDPQLKDFNNYIPLPAEAESSARRLFGPENTGQLRKLLLDHSLKTDWLPTEADFDKVTPLDRNAVSGAALDAYLGCVEDGKKQLRIKYESWQALVTSAPQRAAAEKEYKIRECRTAIGNLNQLKQNAAALQQQISSDEQALAAQPSTGALPETAQTLNSFSCSLR